MSTFSCKAILSGEAPANQPVTVRGWVRTRRDSKAGLSFVHVSDGSSFHPVQVVAVDVEGDAQLAHGRLESAVEGADLRDGHLVDALEKPAVNLARLAAGAVRFIVRMEMPVGAHAARRSERRLRAERASASMARRSSPGSGNFFSGRR